MAQLSFVVASLGGFARSLWGLPASSRRTPGRGADARDHRSGAGCDAPTAFRRQNQRSIRSALARARAPRQRALQQGVLLLQLCQRSAARRTDGSAVDRSRSWLASDDPLWVFCRLCASRGGNENLFCGFSRPKNRFRRARVPKAHLTAAKYDFFAVRLAELALSPAGQSQIHRASRKSSRERRRRQRLTAHKLSKTQNHQRPRNAHARRSFGPLSQPQQKQRARPAAMAPAPMRAALLVTTTAAFAPKTARLPATTRARPTTALQMNFLTGSSASPRRTSTMCWGSWRTRKKSSTRPSKTSRRTLVTIRQSYAEVMATQKRQQRQKVSS